MLVAALDPLGGKEALVVAVDVTGMVLGAFAKVDSGKVVVGEVVTIGAVVVCEPVSDLEELSSSLVISLPASACIVVVSQLLTICALTLENALISIIACATC